MQDTIIASHTCLVDKWMLTVNQSNIKIVINDTHSRTKHVPRLQVSRNRDETQIGVNFFDCIMLRFLRVIYTIKTEY